MNFQPVYGRIVYNRFQTFPRPVYLRIVFSSIIILILFSNSCFAQFKTTASNIITPELERNVMTTLKKSNSTFQLIENKGQLGLPKNVIAYFSTSSQIVFIENDRLRIVVVDPIGNKKNIQKQLAVGKNKSSFSSGTGKFHYSSFSLLFKNSLGFKQFEKGKHFETQRNFFNSRSPKNAVTNVASYEEITLKDVYDGIDLRLYSEEKGELEFDWIVWPGSDPNKIRMKFEGQKKLSINGNGELIIRLELGQFYMRMPESYYSTPNGKEIADVRFRLERKDEITFKNTQRYNGSYPLVIDPDLLWGTFFDGGKSTFDEYLYSIEYNYNNGLIYCGGVANQQIPTAYAAAISSGYQPSFDSVGTLGYGNTGNPQQEGLIYALTKDGQSIQYITYIGGSDSDVIAGLSLSNSNVFVCGFTSSSDFPITNGSGGTTAAFDNAIDGTRDGFVAVLSSSLNQLLYASYLGGSSSDSSLTIRATSDNSFYVSLNCTSSLPISSPNYLVNYANNSFSGPSEEAWIGKFTNFNQLDFGTYIGGTVSGSNTMINDFQLLSNGDVVFIGSTDQITEVNGTVSNGSLSDVLFGRIIVPLSGAVSFGVLEQFGGTKNDKGYGIYSLGDSVSILVGQTQSSDFPTGSGTKFQNSLGGNIDGFIVRINNDGSGGYKANYVGGSKQDNLVSIRPIVLNNNALLMGFGATQSTNLSVTNYNSGTFFSNANSGGWDMMFLICDMTLSTKYYLSYVGGSDNDYLGATGVPVGSNHLFYNTVDSVLYVGTTTHSLQSTQAPKFVGRGINDVTNFGVPVFDSTKNNNSGSDNDTHVIIAISTKLLYSILASKWQNFETGLNSDCSVQLFWAMVGEDPSVQYTIQRSKDGTNFESIGSVTSGNQNYTFTDMSAPGLSGVIYYRIAATAPGQHTNYSKIDPVQLCNDKQDIIRIYPTISNNFVYIQGLNFTSPKNILISLYNASGNMLMQKNTLLSNNSIQFSFGRRYSSGNYIISIKDPVTGEQLHLQKIIIRN